MWVIRFLNGPMAGKTLQLHDGKNILGRNTDLKIPSGGASKEHLEITVTFDRVILRDLQSRNGTFVNGVRVQNALLKSGDKVGVHDVIFEVTESKPQVVLVPQPQVYHQHHQAHMPPPPGAAASQNYMTSQGFFKGLLSNMQDYVERVALPGVYRLPELVEFKWVICGFMAVLVFAVTVLCMLPAVQVTKASLLGESKRRAQSLARSLGQLNQQALLQGSVASVSTYSIETEDGVKHAYIVQQADGLIIAPATHQGRTSDFAFIHAARRENKPQVGEIDGSTIGASFPIGVYDPNTGEPNVKYHAIIIYDVKSLALDDGRAISLFMQALILATLAGLLVFYFLYKMIEHPLLSVNTQLDTAIRENKDDIRVSYKFSALQSLIGNINSLLSRRMHGESGAAIQTSHVDEAAKMTALVSEGCLVLKSSGEIVAANAAFSEVSRLSPSQLVGQFANAVPDQSLQQNLEFLLNRAKENPFQVQNDQLEFGGILYQINCQAFGQPIDYFIITLFKAKGAA